MFILEQGITSPRDNSVNWTPFESFETLAQAKREARKNKGKWRIVESVVVWNNTIDK